MWRLKRKNLRFLANRDWPATDQVLEKGFE
jgi:hypothetical protein